MPSAEKDAPRWQLRWWRPGGFRWPWLARRTNGRCGLGRWTEGEVDRIKADAAEQHARIFPPAEKCGVCGATRDEPEKCGYPGGCPIPPEKQEES